MRECRHRAVRYFWIGFAWGRLEMGETAKHKADAAICQHCGHWLPLGPARDDERTAVELRAALLSLPETDEDLGEYTQTEWAGFNDDEMHSRGYFDVHSPEWSAGYLSGRIHAHHDEQSKEGM